ncbi:MAG: tRNA pseudouridine(55) synthase TruB [Actinomycetota bacterium]|nr:tRNA pseudouridine(55) synthase TruB [Actinomycetota bacterium]
MEGILIVDKPAGRTSREITQLVKQITSSVKAGHIGTLDPIATGVLPISLGRATLLADYLVKEQKIYLARAALGIETDTYDVEGKIIFKKDFESRWIKEIESCLDNLRGRIEQTPPPFSAIKVRGRHLYDFARRGEKVEAERRWVEVSELSLLNWEKDDKGTFIELRIVCSAGTYVRSLIHDLGKLLGSGACVTKLRRLKSGNFDISSAVRISEVLESAKSGSLGGLIKSMEDATSHIPSIRVGGSTAIGVRMGKPLTREVAEIKKVSNERLFRVLGDNGELLAFYTPALNEEENQVVARARRVIRPYPDVGEKNANN